MTPPTPTGPLRIGDVFLEKYQILEVMGRGGYGCVYRAESLFMSREVAIKVTDRPGGLTEEVRGRGQREAVALGKLGSHPNIVDVYDAGISPQGHLYIVMPLLEGQTLGDRLKDEGPYGIEEGLELLEHLCAALEHARVNRVIHRDLKPANIFLPTGSQPQILDFGVSKIAGSAGFQTAPNMIVGTSLYVSPEQIRAQPATHRSDIYSLGLIAFQIFHGQHPLILARPDVNKRDPKSIWTLHIRTPAPLLDEVLPEFPDYVARLVNTALVKEPGQRYASAGDFAKQVSAALSRYRAEQRAKRPSAEYHPIERHSPVQSGGAGPSPAAGASPDAVATHASVPVQGDRASAPGDGASAPGDRASAPGQSDRPSAAGAGSASPAAATFAAKGPASDLPPGAIETRAFNRRSTQRMFEGDSSAWASPQEGASAASPGAGVGTPGAGVGTPGAGVGTPGAGVGTPAAHEQPAAGPAGGGPAGGGSAAGEPAPAGPAAGASAQPEDHESAPNYFAPGYSDEAPAQVPAAQPATGPTETVGQKRRPTAGELATPTNSSQTIPGLQRAALKHPRRLMVVAAGLTVGISAGLVAASQFMSSDEPEESPVVIESVENVPAAQAEPAGEAQAEPAGEPAGEAEAKEHGPPPPPEETAPETDDEQSADDAASEQQEPEPTKTQTQQKTDRQTQAPSTSKLPRSGLEAQPTPQPKPSPKKRTEPKLPSSGLWE